MKKATTRIKNFFPFFFFLSFSSSFALNCCSAAAAFALFSHLPLQEWLKNIHLAPFWPGIHRHLALCGLEKSNMSASADATTSMFLSRALQKILSEKETKQKQHAKLRAACESALGMLDSICVCVFACFLYSALG